MLLPRPIKKMIAVFRGGLSPQIIALSITLGFTCGLIPGFSGIHMFIILLFLLMNVHLGLFLLSLGIGKSICIAAAPLLYHVGGAVQDYLQIILVFMGNLPIIGLTDFNRYAVAGGLVLGPIIGIVIGILFAAVVMKFRKTWLKLEEGSEAYKKWTSKKWVKILDRLLIGKKTKDVKAAVEAKSPIFRKAGLVLVGIPLIAMAGLGMMGQNERIARYASNSIAKANGAEVNIASMGISPVSGSVTASKIQVTDPAAPKFNQLAVDTFTANAGVFDLLAGKVVIDNVHVDNLTFNTPREKEGEVFKKEETAEEEKFDPSEIDVKPEDIGKLEKYYKNTKKLKETLQKIKRFLPDKKKPGEKKTIPETIKEYLTATAEEGSVAKFIAKNIALDKVQLPGEQFGLSNIKLTNLSDAPIAYGKPIGIEVKSAEGEKSVQMEIDFQQDGTGNITGTFANLDLAAYKSQLSDENPMQIEKGTAGGKFAGTISKDTIDITVDLDIKDLKASSSGKGTFGLDAKTTSEVFKAMENMQTQLRIVGPISSPSIAFDSKGLAEHFQQTLIAAGKKKAADELNKQIEKNLGGKAGEEIKKVIGEDTAKDLIDGIGGLLGGKKDKDK